MVTTDFDGGKILQNSKQIGSEFNEYSDHTVQYLLLENLHGDDALRNKVNFRSSAFADQRMTSNYCPEEVTAVTG